ncbi:MAG: hypothetical protein ACKOPQ_00530 [Novosphingobium sp.]
MASASRVPGSFWAISIVSLLWNSFGCYDYFMTKTDPVNYMKSMGLSDETIAYMDQFPAWLSAFWALGVWGSLAGSVLLLMRSRHAVTAFIVSLVGLAVSQAYQFFGGVMPAEMKTGAMIGMTVVIWAALLFFIWYSRRARAAGYLR